MTAFAALPLAVCVLLETFEHLCYSMASRVSRGRVVWTACGVSLHLLVLAAWFWLLTLIPLGVAMPLMGTSYATTAFASRILFKEHVDAHRWMGIVTIMMGLVIIWSAHG